MAGIIVADTIQSGGSFIRLNSASQTVATINASGIYANTGNLLIASNGTIGVASITNTAITGTMTQAQIGTGVAGTGPAFSAYLGTNQTVGNATNTKAQINTENFDTASAYDNSTNYRFTPQVAGYYFFNAGGTFGQGSNSVQTYIYKNGSVVFVSGYQNQASGSGNVTPTVSGLLYMNGTTDYVEFYVYQSSGGNLTLFASGPYSTYFTGHMVRAA